MNNLSLKVTVNPVLSNKKINITTNITQLKKLIILSKIFKIFSKKELFFKYAKIQQIVEKYNSFIIQNNRYITLPTKTPTYNQLFKFINTINAIGTKKHTLFYVLYNNNIQTQNVVSCFKEIIVMYLLNTTYLYGIQNEQIDVLKVNYLNNNFIFNKLIQYLTKNGNKQQIEHRLLTFLKVENLKTKKLMLQSNCLPILFTDSILKHKNSTNYTLPSIKEEDIASNTTDHFINNNLFYLITKLLLILQPISKLVTYKRYRKSVFYTKKVHLLKKQENVIKLFVQQIIEKNLKNIEKNIISELKKLLLLSSSLYEKQINSIRYLNKYKNSLTITSKRKIKKVYRKKDILVTKKKLNNLLLKYQKLIA